MYKTVVVIGRTGSGKGSVASLLEEKGFRHISASSEVKRDVVARRLPESHEYYKSTCRLSRIELGNDIFGRYCANAATQWRMQGTATDVVIEGLRHPEEIQYMKDKFGASILWIDADDDVRYERVRGRKRDLDGDNISREFFSAIDLEDRGVDQPEYANRLDDCKALADVVIKNNGTRNDLREKVDSLSAFLGIEGVSRSKER